MIKAGTFKNKNIAVFGLGRTGITAALSLKAGGAKVYAWDDNAKAVDHAKEQGVPIADLSKVDWDDIDELVLSPGVPDTLPEAHWTAKAAKAAGVPIICDIEIFAREVMSRAEEHRPKIIAITGTNGKSTTTALVGHILKACGKDAQIGGNIGRGVLDLDSMHAGTHYVLELSSYQLERTSSLRANVAIFLNLSPDHLERHGDMDHYEAAKRRIFLNQNEADTVVIGVDNPEGRRICSELKVANGRRIVPISGRKSLGHGVCALKGKLYCAQSAKVVEVANLNKAKALEGMHNWQNAAAAYAAVSALGIDPQSIGDALLSFPGLAHRMETVGEIVNVRFVNDSKATNANAAQQALGSYKNIYWIAGGQAKSDGIEPLEKLFPNIRKAYLIGEAAPSFHKTLTRADVDHKISGTMEMAVLCALRDALNSGVKKPIVLLSPACASFDQFKNFEVRGDEFRAQIESLMERFKHTRQETAA